MLLEAAFRGSRLQHQENSGALIRRRVSPENSPLSFFQEAAELPMGAISVQQQEEIFTEGGLCVTCRLSSFSLYIFHPYGNAMRKTF